MITFVGNLFFDAARKRENRQNNLYRPLRHLFLIVDAIENHQEKITKATEASINEINDGNDEPKQEIQKEILAGKSTMSNKLIEKWWEYLEKINLTLEENSPYVKREDIPLIKDFISGYISREYLGKAQQKKIAPWLYKKLQPEDQKFINSVRKLKKRIIRSKLL